MNADIIVKHNRTTFFEYILHGVALLLVIAGIWIVICVFHHEPNKHAAKTPLRATRIAAVQPPATQPAVTEDPIKDYWTVYGTKGDFTAGVGGTLFALAGFFYLLLSFKKQQESNNVQIESFKHDKIESRFFELIGLHRDNVAELSFTFYVRPPVTREKMPTTEKEKETVTHRKVFQAVKQQYAQAFEELAFFFAEAGITEIYEDAYLNTLKANTTIIDRKIDLKGFARVDIIYLLIFFGVGKDGTETILSITDKKYKPDFLVKALKYAALKPKVQSDYWLQWATINLMDNRRRAFEAILAKWERPKTPTPRTVKLSWRKDGCQPFKMFYPDNYEKYYGGHQFRLGHYFRHLYQTVSFINEQEDLPGKEQRGYIRHLRGQLSTDEQIVFFLNSLSQLGRIWELEDKQKGIAVDRKYQMITDYSLIKNIPNNNVISELKLTDFYPEIRYEGFTLANDLRL